MPLIVAVTPIKCFFFLPTRRDKPQGMRYENILNKRLTKHLIEVNTHKKGNTNRISEHLVTVYAPKKKYTKPYSTTDCFGIRYYSTVKGEKSIKKGGTKYTKRKNHKLLAHVQNRNNKRKRCQRKTAIEREINCKILCN